MQPEHSVTAFNQHCNKIVAGVASDRHTRCLISLEQYEF
jgi:hypothetical protein